MRSRLRCRPSHLLALALLAVPAWKALEWSILSFRPKRVDPESVALGAKLFHHEFEPNDPLTGGDGLGPVFNARSCVECHHQGGPGGGGPVENNVTVYGIANGETRGLPAVGVVHRQAIAPEFQESLAQVGPGLPNSWTIPLEQLNDRSRTVVPTGYVVTQRNTPALFGAGLMDAISDNVLIAHQREHSVPSRLVGLNSKVDSKIRGRVPRLADGRVGRFGWKSEFATLDDFVRAACANELGLSNPGRPQATPMGRQDYQEPGIDLTEEQCAAITDFLIALPRPEQVLPEDSEALALAEYGRLVFEEIGCADCHTPKLGAVDWIYSDMLLHDLGVELESSTGYYGAIIPNPTVESGGFASFEQPKPGEWRTPPLWGVADSAPYLHDGRAETLEEAISWHGGEAEDVRDRFDELHPVDRDALIGFLKTLRAPEVPSALGGYY
ncbi:di-heme oxidoredictase family protein [soil metagenome]